MTPMNISEARLAGLGTLFVLTVATGGCGVADAVQDAAAPASAKPLAPRDALLKSLPDASTGSFRFAVEGGEAPTAGEIDAGRQSYRVGFRYREPEAGFTMLADIVDPARLKALGEKAKAVPFEATVDGQGRLTSAVVKVPAAGRTKASRYEITYADYGTTASPAAPAADEQQPATRSAYELLNA